MTDEAAFLNNEAATESLTNVDSASPHALVFYIRNKETGERLIDPATNPPRPLAWVRRFPTIDAASQVKDDVFQATKIMRGEPEQAWSDVARLSGCPNPALLARFRNIEMEIIPIPQKEPNLVARPTNPIPGITDSFAGNQPGASPPDSGPGTNSPKPRRANSKTAKRTSDLPAKGSPRKKAASKSRSKKTD